MAEPRYLYRSADRFLLRVNRWRSGLATPEPPDTPSKILADPDLDLAVLHAAPGLHAWARRSTKTASPDPAKLLSLQRYYVRAHTRPTPFGLFSAVGAGIFADTTDLAAMVPRSERTRIHIRPDLGLVAAIARETATGAGSYRANDLIRREADRFFLPGVFALGRHEDREARVRVTDAVALLIERARTSPRTLADLESFIGTRYPTVDPARIRRTIQDLVDLGFLIPNAQVRLSHRGSPPVELAPAAAEILQSLTSDVAAADRGRLADALGVGNRTAREHSHDGDAVEVHVGLTGTAGILPRRIGAAIADAATFLTAVAPGAGDGALSNREAMIEYHRLFLERFGFGSAVRLADLLDPVRGLGSVAQAIDATGRTARELTPYEWVLHDLLTSALHDGAAEIRITADVEARLVAAVPTVDTDPPQPSIDVFAQIAEDDTAIEGFRVILNHAPVAEGGTTFGRFAHLLDPDFRAEILGLRRYAVTAPPDTAREVQFSYLPRDARAGNVAVAPTTGDHLLAINAPLGTETTSPMGLDDLWVVADYERLRIWSRSLGEEVHPTQSHMLTAQLAPDIVQVALQIGAVRRRPLGGFSWGPFERSLRLPRVVRGDVVIRSAEWTITVPEHLDPSDALTFRRSLDEWRRTFDVPAHVYDVQDDNRLLLDLDSEFAERHLRSEARRRTVIRLQEALPHPEQHVVTDERGGRYAAEFVVPVRLAQSSRRRGTLRYDAPAASAAVHAPFFVDDTLATRDGWMSFHLYTPARVGDAVLGRLAGAMTADPRLRSSVDRWYFVRYRDQRSHLRLRLRVRPGRENDVRAAVRDLHEELRRRGMSSDVLEMPYRPEYGRYATPEHFDRFESLFCLESAMVAGPATSFGTEDRRVLALGLMALYVRALVPDADEAESFLSRLRSDEIRSSDRGYVRANMPLLTRALAADATLDEDGPLGALAGAAPSLQDAMDDIIASCGLGRSGLDDRAEGILRSVLHMTCNRLLPPDGDEEGRVYDIWWLTARRLRGVDAHARRS